MFLFWWIEGRSRPLSMEHFLLLYTCFFSFFSTEISNMNVTLFLKILMAQPIVLTKMAECRVSARYFHYGDACSVFRTTQTETLIA
jgi:hypothetical protein